MPGAFWAIVAFLLWIVGTVAVFIIINVAWPATERRGHNEVVGWQLSVIGTSYAVILAFMLFNVWDNFRTADRDHPANHLRGRPTLPRRGPRATARLPPGPRNLRPSLPRALAQAFQASLWK